MGLTWIVAIGGPLAFLIGLPLYIHLHSGLPICPSGPAPSSIPSIRTFLTPNEKDLARRVVEHDPLLAQIAAGQSLVIDTVNVSSDPDNGTDAAIHLHWLRPTEDPARLFFGPPLTGPVPADKLPGTYANLTAVNATVSADSARLVGVWPAGRFTARGLPKATCSNPD